MRRVSSSFRAASVCAASNSVELRSGFVHLQVKRPFFLHLLDHRNLSLHDLGICLFPELCLMTLAVSPIWDGLSICITSVTSALVSPRRERPPFDRGNELVRHFTCVNFAFSHPWHLNDLVIECCVRANSTDFRSVGTCLCVITETLTLCVGKLRRVNLHCWWTGLGCWNLPP